jgi:glycosyltransferase involved in cell wall biosynthesis
MLDPLFHPYHGGTEKVVLEVGRRLVRDHGHEVTVLTSMIPQAKGIRGEMIEGLEVLRTPSIYMEDLPAPLPPPFTFSPLHLVDMLRHCRGMDVYHVHNRFWYSPLTFMAVRSLLRGELYLTIHNSRPRGIDPATDRWGGLFDDIEGQMVFGMCHRINCVSRSSMVDTVPEEMHGKCRVIYNGVDTARFRPDIDPEEVRKKLGLEGREVVLTNGRMVAQKGQADLLKAFALVAQSREEASLVMIGRGPLKNELMRLAHDLGIADRVVMTTNIPEEELPAHYCAADVFALPSLFEPSAVVLYEALACGVPVVATDAGGNSEIIDRGSGIIVPKAAPQAMADTLMEVLSNDALRKNMAVNARQRAVDHFDWSHIAAAWDRSYRS